MPTAIVTGATGMLGRGIVHELSKNLATWTQVHALSRSKSEDFADNVVHNKLDLTSDADEMAKQLSDVKADYVFFAAYLAKDDEAEATKVNGAMLDNFLKALEKTGAVKQLKRIVLVTGAKQYGVHLGRPKNPMLEDDPWLRQDQYPPNFYYKQQDILHEYCKKHKGLEWVVTYPNDVIGFVKGNFMNLATPLALYALINKELGNDLEWPGSQRFYTAFDCFTQSKLHAEFCHWAALEPKAANQAFNVVNGSVDSWQDMWPRLASHFDMKVKRDQFDPSEKNEVDQKLHDKPPITVEAESNGLYGNEAALAPSKLEGRIDLVKWSQSDDVKKAWEKIAERENLEKDALEGATWGFLQFILGRNFDLVISMSKARKFGWTGYVDTWDSLEETFKQLEIGQVLPKRA